MRFFLSCIREFYLITKCINAQLYTAIINCHNLLFGNGGGYKGQKWEAKGKKTWEVKTGNATLNRAAEFLSYFSWELYDENWTIKAQTFLSTSVQCPFLLLKWPFVNPPAFLFFLYKTTPKKQKKNRFTACNFTVLNTV